MGVPMIPKPMKPIVSLLILVFLSSVVAGFWLLVRVMFSRDDLSCR